MDDINLNELMYNTGKNTVVKAAIGGGIGLITPMICGVAAPLYAPILAVQFATSVILDGIITAVSAKKEMKAYRCHQIIVAKEVLIALAAATTCVALGILSTPFLGVLIGASLIRVFTRFIKMSDYQTHWSYATMKVK